MGTKRKDLHKQETIAKKSAIQSLEFLTTFGLKQISAENTLHEYADAELKDIIALDLYSDLLEIQKFIDNIKRHLNADVAMDKGNLCHSVVCIALGISRVEEIHRINISPNTWRELLKQKVISIYYPEEIRNKVIAWAKEKGYVTSTHLGQPIIKFSKLFLSVKRVF